jgi:hypothetical protein
MRHTALRNRKSSFRHENPDRYEHGSPLGDQIEIGAFVSLGEEKQRVRLFPFGKMKDDYAVDTNGIITNVAGTGPVGFSGDGEARHHVGTLSHPTPEGRG